MNHDQRKILRLNPVIWNGDLHDDCTAEWAGLMLRAEQMDKDYWWWAVYDTTREGVMVDGSNNYDNPFINGLAARNRAEHVANQYIDVILSEVAGQFKITSVFRITGRGLVFAGHVTEGSLSVGNTIEFIDSDTVLHRVIIGIETVRKTPVGEVNTGILVACTDEAEIDRFREEVLLNQISTVFE